MNNIIHFQNAEQAMLVSQTGPTYNRFDISESVENCKADEKVPPVQTQLSLRSEPAVRTENVEKRGWHGDINRSGRTAACCCHCVQ